MANETKIVITAATGQAEASLAKLGQSVGNMSRQMFDLSGVLGTLGGALTVTAFAGIIRQSIDAADELHNLSIKTGTSVEQLAGLKYAAEQSDTSLQAVAGAAKKLASNIAENPDLFKKFGVDAKDSTGALIQLADIFSTMPDGVEKTALAVKLMGKSGEEMIPFLNQGGAAIHALVETGKEYNPVTAESARMAAEFNDNLDKLKASAGQAGMTLTNDLLPQLTDISTAMALAAREGGLLKAAWVGLGGLGAALFTDDMLPRMQQINNELEKLRRWEASLEGSAITRMFHPGDLRDTRAQIILLELELKELQKTAAAPVKKPDVKPVGSGNGKNLLSALGEDGKSKKKKYEQEFNPEADFWFAVDEARLKNSLKAQEDYLRDMTKAEDEANKGLQRSALEAQKIILDIDPIARASAEWERLLEIQEAVGKEALSDEQIAASYKKTFEGIGKDGNATFQSLEDAVRGWGNAFTDEFSKMVRTGKMDFASLADSIINDLIRIQIQKNVTDPLVKAGTSWLDGLFKGIGGGGGAGGASSSSGFVDTGGFSQMLGSFDGGGFTGAGPRTGGIDGRGGFPAILHPNETVVDHTRGQSVAPSVVVNVINQSGKNLNARQQGEPQFDGRGWVLGIVLDAADSDPNFRNAMGMA